MININELDDKLTINELFKNSFTDDEIFDLFCDDQSDCPSMYILIYSTFIMNSFLITINF